MSDKVLNLGFGHKFTNYEMRDKSNIIDKLPPKYQARISAIGKDKLGYYIFLNMGWSWQEKGNHLIRVYSKKDIITSLLETELCDCHICERKLPEIYIAEDKRWRSLKE